MPLRSQPLTWLLLAGLVLSASACRDANTTFIFDAATEAASGDAPRPDATGGDAATGGGAGGNSGSTGSGGAPEAPDGGGAGAGGTAGTTGTGGVGGGGAGGTAGAGGNA